MTTHDYLYVFDLDGVVTDPATTAINDDVLTHIAASLQADKPVVFNTGRPYEWAEENILHHLQPLLTPSQLDNLLLVAEMGSILYSFKDGQPNIQTDETLALPPQFIHDTKQLLTEGADPYQTYMWWDDEKHTMGSLVKHAHVAIDDFNRVRPLLANDLNYLLTKHNLTDFMLGQTTIATDIQHRNAGKHKGAKQVLAWLDEKQLRPRHYYAFGDSPSDKAMAEEFSTTGTPTTFVFVGDPSHEESIQGAYTTTVTGGNYSHDTATWLKKHSTQKRK
jgi:hydroxymethylpyrimidine pyrophosphatase-like HAD family hydrolase